MKALGIFIFGIIFQGHNSTHNFLNQENNFYKEIFDFSSFENFFIRKIGAITITSPFFYYMSKLILNDSIIMQKSMEDNLRMICSFR